MLNVSRYPVATQKGPCAGWFVVSVPRGGPSTTTDVSTKSTPSVTETLNGSIPRGAGPSWYSPAWLYFEPWHGHSNHLELSQNGTRHPRWTHFWYRAMSPSATSPVAA